MKKTLTLSSLVAAAALSVAGVAQAAFTYSTGFEQSTYTPGTLDTQGGWSVIHGGNATPPTVDVQSINHGGSQGVKYNSTNRAVDMSGTPTGLSYVISPVRSAFAAQTADTLASDSWLVNVKWDLRVDDNVNPLLGTEFVAGEIYDSTANERVAGFARGYDVGQTNTQQLYRTGSDGEFFNTGIAAAPASGVWGTYEMQLNYASRKFSVLLNGTPILANQPMNTAADNGFDFDFTMQGHGVDAMYIDNFSVTAVPEPVSIGTVAAVTVVGLARRRK